MTINYEVFIWGSKKNKIIGWSYSKHSIIIMCIYIHGVKSFLKKIMSRVHLNDFIFIDLLFCLTQSGVRIQLYIIYIYIDTHGVELFLFCSECI